MMMINTGKCAVTSPRANQLVGVFTNKHLCARRRSAAQIASVYYEIPAGIQNSIVKPRTNNQLSNTLLHRGLSKCVHILTEYFIR